jgi:DNA-binding PadR family transcriptional regulator
MANTFLGEFEQMILLAVLRLPDEPYAPAISRTLEEDAGRRVSRGALYTTLERLEKKGYVEWEVAGATSTRGGNRKRAFSVTDDGLQALRSSHQALAALSTGLEGLLTKGRR